MAILTSITGTNGQLFSNAFSLYGSGAADVLDVTYGRGVFWRFIDTSEIRLIKNDLDEQRGDTSYSSESLPSEWLDKFDFAVYDPPYMHGQKYGTIKKSISQVYNNNQSKCGTMNSIREMYRASARELHRVVKHKGFVAVKCMDSIESGKQKRLHIWVWQDFLDIGFRDEDLFTLTPVSRPAMRWKTQYHARKNISYLWIFKVWKR